MTKPDLEQIKQDVHDRDCDYIGYVSIRKVDFDALLAAIDELTQDKLKLLDAVEVEYLERKRQQAAVQELDGQNVKLAATIGLQRRAIDELKAQRDAVLALHAKQTDSRFCDECDNAWPCETVRALGVEQIGEAGEQYEVELYRQHEPEPLLFWKTR